MSRRDEDDTHFTIVPDPPIAGQPAEVHYKGKLPAEIDIFVDGKSKGSKRPDKDGKLVIDPVPVGRELALSDGFGHPGYVTKEIQELEH